MTEVFKHLKTFEKLFHKLLYLWHHHLQGQSCENHWLRCERRTWRFRCTGQVQVEDRWVEVSMDKLCCDEQARVHTCDGLRCDVKLYARVQRIRLCLQRHVRCQKRWSVERLGKVKGGRLQAYVGCLGSDNTKKPPVSVWIFQSFSLYKLKLVLWYFDSGSLYHSSLWPRWPRMWLTQITDVQLCALSFPLSIIKNIIICTQINLGGG